MNMESNNYEARLKAIERQQKTILENQESIMGFLHHDVRSFQKKILDIFSTVIYFVFMMGLWVLGTSFFNWLVKTL